MSWVQSMSTSYQGDLDGQMSTVDVHQCETAQSCSLIKKKKKVTFHNEYVDLLVYFER